MYSTLHISGHNQVVCSCEGCTVFNYVIECGTMLLPINSAINNTSVTNKRFFIRIHRPLLMNRRAFVRIARVRNGLCTKVCCLNVRQINHPVTNYNVFLEGICTKRRECVQRETIWCCICCLVRERRRISHRIQNEPDSTWNRTK